MSTNIKLNTFEDDLIVQKGPDYWKWIIAFACSWINAFIFGVFRSAGVLYGAFVAEFHCTYKQASWPISLAGAIASITGIVAGFLTHYFDIRTLVFVGVFISSTAISLCYLATDIYYIIISLGFIQGVGIGLVTNLLPAIISQYFGKQRAIACGISYAGSTAGAFIFPLFIEWQLQKFGLRGTLLLMGGITLHGLIGALLLRPIDTNDKPMNKNRKNGFNDNNVVINREPLIDECETVVFLHQNIETNHQYVNINQLRERPKSIADFDKVVKMRDTSHHPIDRNRAKRMSLPVFHERKVVRYLNQSLANQPMNDSVSSQTKIKFSLIDSIRRHVSEDIKILIDIHFELCTITYLCFILNFVSFLIVLPDFAGDKGLTAHEGTLLLSLYSITDLFGRLIPGWVSYLDFLSNKNIYSTSIGVMGLCFLLFPLANSFAVFAILTLICGFVTGCQMVLTAVVLSEYLGADRTAMAFGLSNFICGSLVMIVRPVLIGIKDRTGEYDILFYVLGCLAIGSAILWVMEFIRSYLLSDSKH